MVKEVPFLKCPHCSGEYFRINGFTVGSEIVKIYIRCVEPECQSKFDGGLFSFLIHNYQIQDESGKFLKCEECDSKTLNQYDLLLPNLRFNCAVFKCKMHNSFTCQININKKIKIKQMGLICHECNEFAVFSRWIKEKGEYMYKCLLCGNTNTRSF